MTCIIGYKTEKGTFLGADSLGSNGHTKAEYTTPKLFKVYDMVIGYTTTYRFGQILQYHMKEILVKEMDSYNYLIKIIVPEIRRCLGEHGAKHTKDNLESGGNCIIGYKNEIYELQNDFSVLSSVNGLITVGSGEDISRGAMIALKETTLNPEECIRKALEITSECVTSVGGTTHILEVPK